MKKPPKSFPSARLADANGGAQLADLLTKLRAANVEAKPALEKAAVAAPSPNDPSRATPLSKAHKAKKDRRRKPQAPKPPKPKGPYYASRLPPEEVARIYRELEGEQAVSRPPKVSSVQNNFGKSSYDTIMAMRPALEAFRADHRAPVAPSPADAELVASRIATAVSNMSEIVDPDAFGFIGYDFGTSTTKAVVRWPLKAGSPGFAVEVPESWAADQSPHIWPTVVFYRQNDQAFSLLPREGMVELSGFKSALIEGSANRMIGKSGLTVQQATVAFLAMHMAYVLGNVAERGLGRIGGINFAVPVASLANTLGLRLFEQTVKAALRLLDTANDVTLQSVDLALASNQEPLLYHELHAELSGVIAGYCRSPRRHAGAHMIIDCGSATLDMATFKLTDAHWPVQVYAAAVERLGSDSLEAYHGAGAAWDDCTGAARYEDHIVCKQSLELERVSFSQNTDRKFTYQLILAGGGIDHPRVKALLDRWQSSYVRPFFRPSLDHMLERDPRAACERLILADGLAWDPVDLKQVVLPVRKSSETAISPNDHDWTSN